MKKTTLAAASLLAIAYSAVVYMEFCNRSHLKGWQPETEKMEALLDKTISDTRILAGGKHTVLRNGDLEIVIEPRKARIKPKPNIKILVEPTFGSDDTIK